MTWLIVAGRVESSQTDCGWQGGIWLDWLWLARWNLARLIVTSRIEFGLTDCDQQGGIWSDWLWLAGWNLARLIVTSRVESGQIDFNWQGRILLDQSWPQGKIWPNKSYMQVLVSIQLSAISTLAAIDNLSKLLKIFFICLCS